MKHLRRTMILAALALTTVLMLSLPRIMAGRSRIPGLESEQRTLLRLWITSAPGGGQAWLTSMLKSWEKQHPGVMTYVRVVSPEEASQAGSVLPDIILYMPGDFTRPQDTFVPLSGELAGREALHRAGRWQGQQYGLPLCWGAWVLAIDSALEPDSAATPAPTTLLGRPAATDAPAAPPGYPLQAASQTACPLQSPGGAALLSMMHILPQEERPPLPDDFAQLSPADVYTAFLNRRYASAMLTTGQATAFTAMVSGGGGFPFRIMTAPEVVTDQVWMASVTPDAPPEAAAFLAFLTGTQAQQALTSQGLHTVRDDLHLYAAGFSAQVEQAADQSLSVINAYIPASQVQSAAWQALQGVSGFSEALLPLL